jgi:hypothetical protein
MRKREKGGKDRIGMGETERKWERKIERDNEGEA